MNPPVLKAGRYQHYKGNFYEVLALARHSETEAWHVVYKTLYGDHSTWIRPLEMFIENVTHDGIKQPRFRYVGEASIADDT